MPKGKKADYFKKAGGPPDFSRATGGRPVRGGEYHGGTTGGPRIQASKRPNAPKRSSKTY